MKQLSGLLILVLLLAGNAFSQSPAPAIKGTVRSSDGQGVPGISILIKETGAGVVTDENGGFSFKKLKPGTYVLQLTAVGIETLQQSVVVAQGTTAVAEFSVRETAAELGAVIINANKRNKYIIKSSEYVARMPLKNLENSQVYSSVSSELIKDQLLVDYRDAFRNVTGVNSLEQVSNGRTSAFIRGFRTGSFLRNGLLANQLTATEIANLEKIEVLKGPSGTLFGASSYISYGGVVNRVTKKPMETAQSEISLTGGSFGMNRLAVDINTPFNKEKTALFRVNAARQAIGSFQENGYQTNYFLAPSFQYKVNEKLTLLVDMEVYNNSGTNTGIGFTPSTTATPTAKSYSDLNYMYNRTFSSDDLTSTFKGYTFYTRADYKINDTWNFNAVYSYAGVNAKDQLQFTPTLLKGDSVIRTVQRYAHHYYNQGAQVNLNGDFHIGTIRNRLLIGADLMQNVTNPTYIKRFNYDSISIAGVAPYITRDKVEQRLSQTALASAFKSKIYNYGIYLSDVVNVTEQLSLMLSVRYDKVDNKGSLSFINNVTTGVYSQSTFSPKAGVVYQVIKDKLAVFGNYLNGFNYSTTTDKEGNFFSPERANQWEGGVKADLLDGKLSATLNYYNIRVSDKLRPNPADNTFQIQDGTQVSKGAEIEVNSSPVNGLHIIAGYAYNNSRFVKAAINVEGKTPSKAPASMANFWTSYHLQKGTLKGLGLGVGLNYNSASWYDDINSFRIPEYTVLSSVLSYDVAKWRLSLRADNLGDVKYWGPWGNPQPPRNYSVGVSFKF
jgi:TonB-dependent siderophore receptor